MKLAPPARTRSSPAINYPCFAVLGYLLTCTIMHVLLDVQRLLGHKFCILLHIRPIEPIAIQSALDKNGCASLAFKSAASAEVGKRSAKPSPAAVALRANSALTSASASPRSR